MMSKALTDAQKELLKQAGDDWRDLPAQLGCANRTLLALEKRGLVEVKYVCDKGARFFGHWQWRATGAVV